MTFFQSYPIELQTQGDHFENPLAPYETLINYEDLSETAKQIMVNNGVNSKSYCQKKLIADFRDRVEYVGEQNLNILGRKYLRLKIHYKFDFPAKNLKRVFSFLFFSAYRKPSILFVKR